MVKIKLRSKFLRKGWKESIESIKYKKPLISRREIRGFCVSLRISSVLTGGGPSGREAGFGAQGGDGGVVSFGTGAGAAGGVVDDAGGIFPVYGVNVVGVFFLLEVQKGRKCRSTSCLLHSFIIISFCSFQAYGKSLLYKQYLH